MPNFKGGKNFKKGKKNRGGYQDKKQLVTKDADEGQEYAQVINPKGNGRFELTCCDGGKTRLGLICGTMRKRVWVNRNDLVLISKWTDMTDDTKCSIIHKYSEDEARRLLKEGELPVNFKLHLDDFEEVGDDDYFAELPSDSDSSDEHVDESTGSDDDGGTVDIDGKVDIDDI
jgi:translation initiation factor 1A